MRFRGPGVHSAFLMCLLLVAGRPAYAQDANDGFDPGADARVKTIAVQSDGKVLVGGMFTTLGGGGTGTASRSRIGRLNADGTADASFNPGANGTVEAIAVQPNGKILVVGSFTMIGGGGTGNIPRDHIARLNSDGTVDPTFEGGADGDVFSVAIQPDGRILVGGVFMNLDGGLGWISRNRIGRLNSDGSVDGTFNPGVAFDANPATEDGVFRLAVQPNSQIVVAGGFTGLGAGTGTTARANIGRLNGDGSVDGSFNPGANGVVYGLDLQADGKIAAGGAFTSLGGSTRNGIGRLNSNGTIDGGFNPGTNGSVASVVAQPDGRILIAGQFSGVGGGTGTTPRANLARVNLDGVVDGGFSASANAKVWALAVSECLACRTVARLSGGALPLAAITGNPSTTVYFGGDFVTANASDGASTPRNRLAAANIQGALDISFNPGANGTGVLGLSLQPDGNIVIGGDFTALGGGGTGSTTRNRLGRIKADGTLDGGFNPGANGTIYTVAVQPDGKILVGGEFTMLGGGGTGNTARNRIGRLNTDGSVDMSFNPGASAAVTAILVRPDGKILVSGTFTGLGGGTGTTPRQQIGLLNSDGNVDMSYDPGSNGIIWGMTLQPDGRLIVFGEFTTLGGGGTGVNTRHRIGRLESNGDLDASFNPGANFPVYAVALTREGRIIATGDFTMMGGGGTGNTSRNHMARLYANGALDPAFNPGANAYAEAIAIQADGKVLVGGLFTTIGGGGTGSTPRNYIARLLADGSVDSTFNPGTNARVTSIALQADGKAVVGGFFDTLGNAGAGPARSRIGRVSNNLGAVQAIDVSSDGTQISWGRAGASPELTHVTIEMSTDSSPIALLGTATRVAGGWQLVGQNLPRDQNVYIRARGTNRVGFSSGTWIESVRHVYLGCAVVTPASLPGGTVNSPYSVTFTPSGLSYAIAGPLPAGIKFNSGVLSGTPTQAGTFTLNLTAQDGAGCNTNRLMTLVVVSGMSGTLAAVSTSAPSRTVSLLPAAGAPPATPRVATVLRGRVRASQASSGASVTAETGFTTSEFLSPASDTVWEADSTRGESVLALREPVALANARTARLTFESWFPTITSTAEVQVSPDGVNWDAILLVPGSTNWELVDVNLDAFLGRSISVRLVLPEATTISAPIWRIADIRLDVRN